MPNPATHIEEIAQLTGLNDDEVQSRLREEGFNELPSSKRHGIGHIALEVIREPMSLLLIASGGIYLMLGDRQEALMLMSFVVLLLAITLFQQNKTERSLEALRDLSSPRASVIRNGQQQRIPGRDVVRDDIVLLAEGDRVPADGRLLLGTNLSVDESLLTGESVPVRKHAISESSLPSPMRPGGEDQPWLFSGTLVVQGQGVMEVTSTGSRTEMGKIGKRLQQLGPEKTHLQQETRKLVMLFALAGFLLSAVLVAVYGLTRHDWLEAFLAGITLAMAMIPEEFPVVLTVFLALGAWRLSKQEVLARRIPVIETLGAATVLCVDKTGTLTQNRMSVVQLYAEGENFTVDFSRPQIFPETFHQVVEFSILASQRDPFDPMEIAFRELGEHFLTGTEHLHDDNWQLMREYPLSKELLAMSRVWESNERHEYVIAAKGAPEAILDLCHMPEAQQKEMLDQVIQLAQSGLRVLAIAKAQFQPPADLPPIQHDFEFQFLGLIGLMDPIRPEVPDAVAQCQSAGIRVVMITGDYPQTAQSIARQIGLPESGAVITGPELEKLSDTELREIARSTNLFARMVPEQKLRLVTALKADGEIVAMTGDGVNDAPALKAADIGIGLGGRGTDVAREAASLVLVKDDFSSIVQAVKMGRRIFDNIQKAIAYILAIHLPIAGLSLIPVLMNWPLILFPMHIAFLHLVIDPACSVVFESESAESNVMQRPPRNSSAPLLGKKLWRYSLLQGLGILVVVLFVFILAMRLGNSDHEARAMAFTTLIIANLSLIITTRSWSNGFFASLRHANRSLRWVLLGTLGFLALVLGFPPAQELFHFEALHGDDLLLCLIIGLCSILLFTPLKRRIQKPFPLDSQ